MKLFHWEKQLVLDVVLCAAGAVLTESRARWWGDLRRGVVEAWS